MLASQYAPTYYPPYNNHAQAATYGGYMPMPPSAQPPLRSPPPLLNPLQSAPQPNALTGTARRPNDHSRNPSAVHWPQQQTLTPQRTAPYHPPSQPPPPPLPPPQPPPSLLSAPRVLVQQAPRLMPTPPFAPQTFDTSRLSSRSQNDRIGTAQSSALSFRSDGGGRPAASEYTNDATSAAASAASASLASTSLLWTRDALGTSNEVTSTPITSFPPGAFPSYTIAAESFSMLQQLASKRRERLMERTAQTTRSLLSLNGIPAQTRYMSVLRSAHKQSVAEALTQQRRAHDTRAYTQHFPIVRLTNMTMTDINAAFDPLVPPSPRTGKHRDILSIPSSFAYMKELISTVRQRSLQAKAPSIPSTPGGSSGSVFAAKFAAATVSDDNDQRQQPTSLIDGAVANAATTPASAVPVFVPTFTPFVDEDTTSRRLSGS